MAAPVTLQPLGKPEQKPALIVRGISKHFTGTVALADVGVTVRRGTVHALIGENGSGKSTLIKILAGVHTADAGSIVINGHRHDAADFSSASARSAGLRFVHQDLGLFGDMSISENFAVQIGYPRNALGAIDRKKLSHETAATLSRFQISTRPQTRVASLAAADRAMVAIARALHDAHEGERILILDEPTASLPDHEAQRLLSSLQQTARDGQSILLVTHKLQEVLAVADRVTVLRDGRVVGDLPTRDCDEKQLIAMIAGKVPEDDGHTRQRAITVGECLLRVEDLWSGGLRGVSMSCARGEIVGILGLLGSGRSRLLRSITGDVLPGRGKIVVAGEPLRLGSTVKAAKRGVALVAEERTQTVFADWLVRYNLSIGTLDRYWRNGVLHRRDEAAEVAASVRRYGIRTPSDSVPASQLSGGNQQKLILARTLAARPKVLLLDEPSVGVDVVARAQIHGIVREAAAAGAAIIVVSSDTDELAQLCDRVLVLAGGRIVREIGPPDVETARLVDALHASRDEPHDRV